MYVAVVRAAVFRLFVFVCVFELVGCGFDHVKSTVLPSVVIVSFYRYLWSKFDIETVYGEFVLLLILAVKNGKSHVYQFSTQFTIIIHSWPLPRLFLFLLVECHLLGWSSGRNRIASGG